jgi:hypothetical protein
MERRGLVRQHFLYSNHHTIALVPPNGDLTHCNCVAYATGQLSIPSGYGNGGWGITPLLSGRGQGLGGSLLSQHAFRKDTGFRWW